MEKILSLQLRGSLAGVSSKDLHETVIAYEPVWAIGTGRNATPEQAQEAHAFIRETLTELSDATTAGRIRIQYGGSVKPENARAMMSQPDIDGALVGGASLDPRSFAQIVQAADEDQRRKRALVSVEAAVPAAKRIAICGRHRASTQPAIADRSRQGEPGRHCPNSPDNGSIISHWEGNIESWFGCIRRSKPTRLNLRFLRAGLPIVVRINQRPLGIPQFQGWISSAFATPN